MADILPQPSDGNSTDNQAVVQLREPAEAIERYKIARNRLLDINHWGDFSGFLSASFELVDPEGKAVHHRFPQKGDFFKIRIPAPSPLQEYDWVKVEIIEEVNEENRQLTAIRVRPSGDPAAADGSVDHFFTDEATSSFLVVREGTTVRAEVHGRNEKPNLSSSSSIGEGIRNVMVSTGAMLGGSGIQWKKLVDGLLRFRI